MTFIFPKTSGEAVLKNIVFMASGSNCFLVKAKLRKFRLTSQGRGKDSL